MGDIIIISNADIVFVTFERKCLNDKKEGKEEEKVENVSLFTAPQHTYGIRASTSIALLLIVWQ